MNCRADSRHMAMRHGVALLTVLMTLVLIAAIAVAGRVQTGAGLAALERDVGVTRARWLAEGCAQKAISVLNDAMVVRRDTAWNDLDLALGTHAQQQGEDACSVILKPLGRVRDANAIDSTGLVRLFRAAGITSLRADSLAAALLDWRDPDTNARLAGAEKSWYRERNRPTPRDGRLRHAAELRLIRGFEGAAFAADTIEALLGVDSVRVDLRHARIAVLLSLKELSEPDARELDRTRAARIADGASVGSSAMNGSLGLAAVASPDAWMLIVRVREEVFGENVEMRWKLGRASDRVGVLSVEEER